MIWADTLDWMNFFEEVALAPYTTLGIGGPAKWFAEAASEADILEAVQFAREQELPLFVLGGGSNLLVSDAGFAGLMVRIGLKGIEQSSDGGIFRVAAGESWDKFVSQVVDGNYAGIECLAGIPGTVGGTPVQNVGAYGQEVSETILGVRAFDLKSLEFVEMTGEECGFSYRTSLFNTTERYRFIVTRVDYGLKQGGMPTLHYADLRRHFQGWDGAPLLSEVATAVRAIRRSKGMFLVSGDPDCASAGSFFKNPVVDRVTLKAIAAAVPEGTAIPQYSAGEGKVKLAAAWLMEQAGFAKGYGDGRVGISSRHTLALVNRGGATAEDILELSARIVEGVEERFCVRLEREPVWVG